MTGGGVPEELVAAARSTAALPARAEAVLGVLGRLVPSDAAWLSVRDGERRIYHEVAFSGAAESLRRYHANPHAAADIEALGLDRRRRPMLTSEVATPLDEVPSWAEYLLPAGFRGGVGGGLFSSTGRHVGHLTLVSEDALRMTEADRRLVAAVSPVIADELDRGRLIGSTARIVAGAFAGVLLTRAGEVLPMPGLGDDRLLVIGSSLVATAVAELDAWGNDVRFLSLLGNGAEEGELVQVIALDCRAGDVDHLRAAVLLSPPGDLLGLDVVHLRVLGALTDGRRGIGEIAAVAGVREAAVADALGQILVTLQVSDVRGAAVRAMRSGLRIPIGIR